MNLNKFEYWAKHQGMSCVKTKSNDPFYTSEQTETAYKYWLAAHSTVLQDLYDDQIELNMIYRSLKIDNKYFLDSCESILNTTYTNKSELDWLFKFSSGDNESNDFVIHKLNTFKKMCLTSLWNLSKYTNLKDFTIWKTKEDYTKNKSVIYDAVFGVSNPGYSAYGLESIIRGKIGPLIMQSRTTLAGYEYKFTDGLIELAIELSEKGTNE